MGFFELVALICALAFGGFVIGKFINLIKTWINRKKPSYDQEKFERLAKAFIQYKKQSKRRIEKLEAAINQRKPEPSTETGQPLEGKKTNKSIEIETEQPKKQTRTDSGRMENMLRES